MQSNQLSPIGADLSPATFLSLSIYNLSLYVYTAQLLYMYIHTDLHISPSEVSKNLRKGCSFPQNPCMECGEDFLRIHALQAGGNILVFQLLGEARAHNTAHLHTSLQTVSHFTFTQPHNFSPL